MVSKNSSLFYYSYTKIRYARLHKKFYYKGFIMAVTNKTPSDKVKRLISEQYEEAAACVTVSGGLAAFATGGAALLRFAVSTPSLDPVTSGTLFAIGAAAISIGTVSSIALGAFGIERIQDIRTELKKAQTELKKGKAPPQGKASAPHRRILANMAVTKKVKEENSKTTGLEQKSSARKPTQVTPAL